jgi:hypothetical protein
MSTEPRWLPWIEKRYHTDSAFGARLLLLGESMYLVPPESLMPHLLERWIKGIVSGKWSYPFYTRVYQTVAGRHIRESTPGDVTAFWQSVAFYNYVQSPVGDRATEAHQGRVGSIPGCVRGRRGTAQATSSSRTRQGVVVALDWPRSRECDQRGFWNAPSGNRRPDFVHQPPVVPGILLAAVVRACRRVAHPSAPSSRKESGSSGFSRPATRMTALCESAPLST